MPPGLIRIDTQALHHGATPACTYAVIDNGHRIGQVSLVLASRPTGATLRRLWWATPPPDDDRPLPRPFDTRTAAVSALRYRHATKNRPAPAQPIDTTLRTITAAHDSAGATAALWLAAAVTIHHLVELDANRQTNPPSLWRELRRIVAWLQAATGAEPDSFSASAVHYRRTRQKPIGGSGHLAVRTRPDLGRATRWQPRRGRSRGNQVGVGHPGSLASAASRPAASPT